MRTTLGRFFMNLKHHQLALSIEEQIDNLKQLGLIINDEENTRSIYYRLIKAYSLGLKNEKHYINITFENIIELLFI